MPADTGRRQYRRLPDARCRANQFLASGFRASRSIWSRRVLRVATRTPEAAARGALSAALLRVPRVATAAMQGSTCAAACIARTIRRPTMSATRSSRRRECLRRNDSNAGLGTTTAGRGHNRLQNSTNSRQRDDCVCYGPCHGVPKHYRSPRVAARIGPRMPGKLTRTAGFPGRAKPITIATLRPRLGRPSFRSLRVGNMRQIVCVVSVLLQHRSWTRSEQLNPEIAFHL